MIGRVSSHRERNMIYYGRGSEREVITDDSLRAGLSEALERLDIPARLRSSGSGLIIGSMVS
jgi:hypothetical protein